MIYKFSKNGQIKGSFFLFNIIFLTIYYFFYYSISAKSKVVTNFYFKKNVDAYKICVKYNLKYLYVKLLEIKEKKEEGNKNKRIPSSSQVNIFL